MDSGKIRGLYAIVDTSFPDPSGVVEEILEGGAKLVQLRAKGVNTGVFLEMAGKIAAQCRKHGAIFIVNDRADIAMASGAGGLHLGQDDIPVEEARKLIGPDKLIGLSTHSLHEARQAVMAGADYIGFGPIFRTGTKKDAGAAKGLEELRGIKAETSIPVVAIGGINEKNILSVFEAGADAAALISALSCAEDIRKATGNMLDLIGDACEC